MGGKRRQVVPPAEMSTGWLAKHMGRSRSTVLSWARAGHIPATRRGRNYYIPLSDFRTECGSLWFSMIEHCAIKGIDLIVDFRYL